MDVGFSGRGYPQTMRGGQANVAIDIPGGVEDDGFPGLLTSDEIGRMRECLVIDQSK